MDLDHKPANARQWLNDAEIGGSFAVLRVHDQGLGVTVLSRFEAGAVGKRHGHPGGEELFVVEGECTVGGMKLPKGDYLFTPPGGEHALEAVTDTTVLLHLPRLPVYGE